MFPNAARWILRTLAKRDLQGKFPVDPHFNPKYNPWEQRLCVCPDGDFYKAIREGKGDVVTDTIKEVSKDRITTTNGTVLPADIIVTATGLRVQMGGGSKIFVDGQPYHIYEKFLWHGMMMSNLPNTAFVIGYTNASWTLGADATALMITRLLNFMNSQNIASATPTVDPELLEGPNAMKIENPMNLNSTYLEKAKGNLPQAGDRGPWKVRKNYFRDRATAISGDLLEGMTFKTANGKVFSGDGKKIQ